MATACGVLAELGLTEVSSYVNSGNLLFTATGKVDRHEITIRSALEKEFGFELATFVRTAAQVRALVGARPFGDIAPGHTQFVLLPLTTLTDAKKKAVEAMSNEHDQVRVQGRDIQWLIRSKSTETTLGPKQWREALPDIPTTARNLTMLSKLVGRL